MEARIEQRTRKNTDHQRGVNLLRDQCKRDRDDRRQQCPNSCRNVHSLFPPYTQTNRVRNSILFYMDLTGFTSANPVFSVRKDIFVQLAMV